MGKVIWLRARLLSLGVALALAMAPVASAVAEDNKTIVFVCQHGVVNSQMAATYFNKVAKERGFPSRPSPAVSKCTGPFRFASWTASRSTDSNRPTLQMP